MRKLLLFLLIPSIVLSSYKVSHSNTEKVKWIRFDELTDRQKEFKKPIIVDLYTDWCHWCKVMDKETYGNEKVANYINDNFIPVTFNAEGRDPVSFRNKTYSFNNEYKVNMLAVALTNGQLSFPTTIIIPDENTQPIPIAGFLKPRELELIIKYFGSGSYKLKSFPDFQKGFHASW